MDFVYHKFASIFADEYWVRICVIREVFIKVGLVFAFASYKIVNAIYSAVEKRKAAVNE